MKVNSGLTDKDLIAFSGWLKRIIHEDRPWKAKLLITNRVTGAKQGRLPFLDWMRGVAAVIMLQGHTFHSFATQQARTEGP